MTKEATTLLSDREREIIQKAADVSGLTFDEAVSQLFSEGLARRSKKRVGKKPSNVRSIRGR